MFTAKLRGGHIRILEKPDEFAWSTNRIGGEYTTKLGYEVTSLNENNTVKWWWSKLWKVKTPKKPLSICG